MKWIELIRVRSSATTLEEAMPSLQKQVEEIVDFATGTETFFMQHASYDGDLAVVVVWKDGSEPRKSREGLLLAERLKELGPIEHAVWIPVEKDADETPCSGT